jgi:hypothetical protein
MWQVFGHAPNVRHRDLPKAEATRNNLGDPAEEIKPGREKPFPQEG